MLSMPEFLGLSRTSILNQEFRFPATWRGAVLFAILFSSILGGSSCKAAGQVQRSLAASVAPRDMVTRPIDEAQRTVLRGNRHPLVRAEFDRGVAPSGLPMRRMLLVLKRSDEQERSLKALLADQQATGSPQFHHWLTPEQFGRQFGPSDGDIEKVTAWLNAHGFQVAGVAKGRTAIEFSGTAGQVQEAFKTAIHSYEASLSKTTIL
jgi:Pro-kumamolisin, activation domain